MNPKYLACFITENVNLNAGLILEFSEEQINTMIRDFVEEKGRPDSVGAFKTYVVKLSNDVGKDVASKDFLNPQLFRDFLDTSWLQYIGQHDPVGNPEEPSIGSPHDRERTMNARAQEQERRDAQIDDKGLPRRPRL
jgi:hypothetical protein